jgi:hypothetical protein
VREWQLRTFGVAPTDQDVCAICGADGPLAVDHCHETKVVRGYLCRGCNTALGFFRDKPGLLRKAADYLEQKPAIVGELPGGSSQ